MKKTFIFQANKLKSLRINLLVALLAFGIFTFPSVQAAPETLRVGVLKFGTVNWELDVIQHHGLAEKEGVKIKVVPLAAKNATHVAIQGGAVDMIVTDWVWVSRQRNEGRDYTFVPYSSAAGRLMVHPDAGIQSLKSLADKKLGVAGGSVDKNWLLLRAYGRSEMGKDIAEVVRPTFAAPPLLNELAMRGEIPAALNFWHYSARLEAAGFETLLSVTDILKALGVEAQMPLIGWVFHESWADKHEQAIKGFTRASAAAKKILAESDEEWDRLRPLLKVKNDAAQAALRDAYRAGIMTCVDQSVVDDADKVLKILAAEGGAELVGKQKALSAGTFWKGYRSESCQR